MSGTRERYLAYVDALNERRFEDLEELLAERLTYNGEMVTREDYQRARREEVALVPDLRWELDLLVVEGDRVAARFAFTCTPSGPFLGLETSGRELRFAEHVFYRFEEGRIVEVVALVDRDAVRRQVQ